MKQQKQRADARQNRGVILAAAQARFATEGLEAKMDDIAGDAGVAVGTLYHHFGTKDGLLEAVVREGLQQAAAYVRTLLDESDPWASVERLVHYFAGQQLNNRVFKELIGTQPALHATAAAIKQELGALIQQIFDRAQAAGQLRADVVGSDLPLLLSGFSEGEIPPDARQRYLEIVLDGLRTGQG